MTPRQFFSFAKKHQAQMVDLKFTDLLGTWQHCSFPIDAWDEKIFQEGVGFDGSSIRGWQAINVSDMLAIPDAATACLDPFFEQPTVSVIANIFDPETLKPYDRDPRYIAQKAEAYLNETGIATHCFVGPEPEFFIFDEVRYEQKQNEGFYQIDSIEGAWNTARFEEPNLGYKPSYKGGYFPVCPTDTLHDIRSEMVSEMQKVGVVVEAHHHEVGTAGQSEIDMRYASLQRMADNFMWFKYIVKNVARRHNKTATFMPKPIFDDNGSGMHTHMSLWKDKTPLFAGNEYAGLSETALYAIGGLLRHAKAVLAFAAPTTNSYHRLVPGFEAPVNLAMSARNRSAAIRIPMYSQSPKGKRLEFRCPDPSCNGYLMFSAMLMAMIDGIQNRIHPGPPLDVNIYEMQPEELEAYEKTPASLEDSLQALQKDHQFLLQGNVFTKNLIQTWIDYKMQHEVNELRLRPHPYEFYLYYDS